MSEFEAERLFAGKLLGIDDPPRGEVFAPPEAEIIKSDDELTVIRIKDEYRAVEAGYLGMEAALSMLFALMERGASFTAASIAVEAVGCCRVVAPFRVAVKADKKRKLLRLLSLLGVKPAFLGKGGNFAEGFEVAFIVGPYSEPTSEGRRIFLFDSVFDAEKTIEGKNYIIVLEDK